MVEIRRRIFGLETEYGITCVLRGQRRLTPDEVDALEWLPSTCAYRLRGEGKPLPSWHHLLTGSRESVHEAGQSVRGWTVSELEAGELERHIVDRTL